MYAGHTPLARHTQNLDGTASGPSSETQTPTTLMPERLPPKDQEKSPKPPSERRDSYFPTVPPPEDIVARQDDPVLKSPLGLTNDGGGDNVFLNELDTKLLQHARLEEVIPETPGESSTASGYEVGLTGMENAKGEGRRDEGEGLEDLGEEQEPRLKIKRSMNFGSQLGGMRGF